MAVVAGQNFGNFHVVRLLGEGGFGEVYEAENPFLQRRAAIKVLHTGMVQDPELVRRFLNEARAASAIRHPNIIDVFDAGVTPEGEPYILMEFLAGDSLQKILLERGRIPLRTVQEIARQAGSALSAAHGAGIVHRDLKPENLFLIPDEGMPLGFRMKVLDFGIAKVKHRDDQKSTLKTQAGLLMGSPSYMSPEQCRDSSDVDLRSDIYSLAVMVYEMLAGVPPFASSSATEMLVLQITAEPPPLRQQVPDLPDYVEQSVMRALAKDRELRYGSVDYFVGALLGTYPALTAQGSAASTAAGVDGPPSGSIYSSHGFGYRRTPAPVPVGNFASRVGLTPGPVPIPSPSITTLSHSTGDVSTSPAASDSDLGLEQVKTKRWPLLAVLGTAAVGVALFFAFRPPGPPAQVPTGQPGPAKMPLPSAASSEATPTVLVRIQSSPPGANVLDEKGQSVLGMTPLRKSYPQGKGSIGVTLRLAGYKDKSITIALDGNSSTAVDLERMEPVAAEATPKPAAARAEPRKPSGARKPPKTQHNEEDEWLVH
jgi:eukaryotic-like serine/threonine-protein kinase